MCYKYGVTVLIFSIIVVIGSLLPTQMVIYAYSMHVNPDQLDDPVQFVRCYFRIIDAKEVDTAMSMWHSKYLKKPSQLRQAIENSDFYMINDIYRYNNSDYEIYVDVTCRSRNEPLERYKMKILLKKFYGSWKIIKMITLSSY